MGNAQQPKPAESNQNGASAGTGTTARTEEKDFDKSTQQCVDCKKPAQMQCLHCAQRVCMDCIQKHISQANESVSAVQDFLNKKITVVDHLATAAKERVHAERKRMMEHVDVQCDQAVIDIDQIAKEQKKRIVKKNTQLLDLSLNEIPLVTRRIIDEMQYLTEDDEQVFQIDSTFPTVVVHEKN